MPSDQDEAMRIAQDYLRKQQLSETEFDLLHDGVERSTGLHRVLAADKEDALLPTQGWPPRPSRSFVMLVDVKMGNVHNVLHSQ